MDDAARTRLDSTRVILPLQCLDYTGWFTGLMFLTQSLILSHPVLIWGSTTLTLRKKRGSLHFTLKSMSFSSVLLRTKSTCMFTAYTRHVFIIYEIN